MSTSPPFCVEFKECISALQEAYGAISSCSEMYSAQGHSFAAKEQDLLRQIESLKKKKQFAEETQLRGKQELTDCQHELTDCQHELDICRQELDAYKQKFSACEQELDACKQKSTREVNAYEQKFDACRQELEDCKKRVAELESTVALTRHCELAPPARTPSGVDVFPRPSSPPLVPYESPSISATTASAVEHPQPAQLRAEFFDLSAVAMNSRPHAAKGAAAVFPPGVRVNYNRQGLSSKPPPAKRPHLDPTTNPTPNPVTSCLSSTTVIHKPPPPTSHGIIPPAATAAVVGLSTMLMHSGAARRLAPKAPPQSGGWPAPLPSSSSTAARSSAAPTAAANVSGVDPALSRFASRLQEALLTDEMVDDELRTRSQCLAKEIVDQVLLCPSQVKEEQMKFLPNRLLKNPPIRKRVLNGDITPRALVQMSARELVPDDLVQQRRSAAPDVPVDENPMDMPAIRDEYYQHVRAINFDESTQASNDDS